MGCDGWATGEWMGLCSAVDKLEDAMPPELLTDSEDEGHDAWVFREVSRPVWTVTRDGCMGYDGACTIVVMVHVPS